MHTVPRVQPPRNTPKSSSFIPNSFQVPNAVVDELLPLLTHAENIVLLWMIRHILGWHDNIVRQGANLSLTTFLNGYRGYKGCGLAKATIVKALVGLRQHNVIAAEDGGQDGTFYRLCYDQVDWDTLYQREQQWNEMQMNLRVDAMNKAKCGAAIADDVEETGGSCHELPLSREGGSCHEPIKTHTKTIAYAPQAGAPDGTDPSPFHRRNVETGDAYEEEKVPTPLIPDLVYEPLDAPKRKSKRSDSKRAKQPVASQKEVKQSRKDEGIISIIGAYIRSVDTVIANPYANTALRAVAKALDEAGITGMDVSTYVADKIAPDPFWKERTVTLKYIAGDILRWKKAKQEQEQPEESVVEVYEMSPEEKAELLALITY